MRLKGTTFWGVILLSLILLSSSGVLYAQTGDIRGVVTDANDGQKLVGAQVSIVDAKIGAVTNVDGEYVIRRVKPGQYTLIAKYIGYKPQQSK